MKINYSYCNLEPYARNKIILRGMLQNNIEFVDTSSSIRLNPLRQIVRFIKIISKLSQADIVFIGFIGHFITPFVRLFTKKPIVLDAYMSAYDTMVLDKKKFKKGSLLAKVMHLTDRLSYQSADIILVDTNEHMDYFSQTFDVPKSKIRRILIGANDEIFVPQTIEKANDKFIIEFHGGFIPLQGVQYIVKAAKLLENEKDILFKIVGNGQTFNDAFELAKKMNVKNVIFEGHKPAGKISEYIAECDIGLGIFGETEKAKRVIPNKAYEIMAMKKPLLTSHTRASEELLRHKDNAYLCNIADANSLARAIMELKKDSQLRDKIASNGYKTFLEKATPHKIGEELEKIFMLLPNHSSAAFAVSD